MRATDITLHDRGSDFDLVTNVERVPVRLPLLGDFNVQNALGAAAAALALEYPLAEIAQALNTVPQVPGRLERIASKPCPVLRDYAHTPDALERVLITLRPLVAGRLIVVFGAGGDRDQGKRPLMGETAQRLADLPIVTSDNPRTEDPDLDHRSDHCGHAGRSFHAHHGPAHGHSRGARVGRRRVISCCWPAKVTRHTRSWEPSNTISTSASLCASCWANDRRRALELLD